LGVVAISESATPRHMGEVTASTQQLRTKSPPLINVQEAARDIRWGIEDYALMEKYRLSPHELGGLFDKLLSAGLITQADLNRRLFLNDHTVDLREEMLSFTEALQQLGLGDPGSATVDGDAQPKPPRANHALNERTKAEEAISYEMSSKTLPEAKVSAERNEAPWYDRPTIVVLLLIGLFPLGLYALYRNSTFSTGIKSLLIGGWVLLVIIYLMLVTEKILPETGVRFLLRV
jgi:sulfur carrier protein ThiS